MPPGGILQNARRRQRLHPHRPPGALLPRPEQPKLARRLCAPKVGVGADGLILLEESERADVAWRFYNADGSEAEMCGNGARCAARFAVLKGMTGPSLTLETLAGIIHCEVMDRSARVQLTDVGDLRLHLEIPLAEETLHGHFLRVGVPHTVIPVPDLEAVPVTRWGRAVRFHPCFSPRAPTSISSRWTTPTNCGSAPTSGAWRTRPWPAAPGRWPPP